MNSIYTFILLSTTFVQVFNSSFANNQASENIFIKKDYSASIPCGRNRCFGGEYCCPISFECYSIQNETCCYDGSVCPHSQVEQGQECCSCTLENFCPSNKFCSSKQGDCTTGVGCGTTRCPSSSNCCKATRSGGVDSCYEPINEICCASGDICPQNICYRVPSDGQCCSYSDGSYRYCPNPRGDPTLTQCNSDGSETCVSPSDSNNTSSSYDSRSMLLKIVVCVVISFVIFLVVVSIRNRYAEGLGELEGPVAEGGYESVEEKSLDPPEYHEVVPDDDVNSPLFASNSSLLPPPPPPPPPQLGNSSNNPIENDEPPPAYTALNDQD